MIKIKNAFLKLSTTQKIFFSLSLLVLIFSLSALIPTLSKLISGTRGSTKVIWDGTIASSFNSGSGTKSDPYVITDGSELAFLSLKLEDTSYNNNYFIITDNINLNEGIFKYENDDIIYILNDEVFMLINILINIMRQMILVILPLVQLTYFPRLKILKEQSMEI